MLSHNPLPHFLLQTPHQLNIPYQYHSIPPPPTHPPPIHLTPHHLPSLSIPIPTTYIHTHPPIIHPHDYQNPLNLLTQLIKRLHQKTVQQITYPS
ncbi:hypothetical protein [Bacillus altitudinis]|uniref:hypothetical protein n=1 Tax=Bacillus altitudinis TaxID=293387 RepID=UPI0011A879D1